VVLTHGEETAAAPAAQGGTGKTQIAVAFSHALWGARAVDALVWVPATSREAIVAGFAQAARTVGAADQALPAEAGAGRFAGWLAHTRRPWALILDDLASLTDLEACGRRVRPGRSSSPPACPDPPSRPDRGSRRSAGSAAARCWRT
jgi:hypothetical protein